MFKSISQFLSKILPKNIYLICVALIMFLSMLFISGFRRIFGVFVAALHQTFNETSLFELNMVGDTYSCVAFFSMPFLTTLICFINNPYQSVMFLVGILLFLSFGFTSMINNAGMLYLTFTIMNGIGTGLVLATMALVVGEYFPKEHKYHVLVTSLASTSPYAMLITTPLLSHLVQNYGWRETCLIYGGIVLCLCLIGCAFLEHIEEKYVEVDTDGEAKHRGGINWKFPSWRHLLEYKEGIFWMIDRIIAGAILFALGMNLTEYRRRVTNYDMEDSAVINICLGVGECAAFTSTMLLGDKMRRYLTISCFLGAIVALASILVLQFSVHTVTIVNVCIVVVGVGQGLTNSTLYAASAAAMHIDGSISLPITKMVNALGVFLSPFVSGMIVDIYGYNGLFISLIILCAVRVGDTFIINFLVYKRRQAEENVKFNQLKVTEDVSPYATEGSNELNAKDTIL